LTKIEVLARGSFFQNKIVTIFPEKNNNAHIVSLLAPVYLFRAFETLPAEMKYLGKCLVEQTILCYFRSPSKDTILRLRMNYFAQAAISAPHKTSISQILKLNR